METKMPPPVPPIDRKTSSALPTSKLDDFCRICLLRKLPLLPLTSEFRGTMIPEMLWKVSGTLLNVLEQLPRMICERCLTKLDLAYSIAQEFRKQEELLRSFCWKGALVEQLDGFQQTEDAGKVPYSDDVLKKLAPPPVEPSSAVGSVPVAVPAGSEKETVKAMVELPAGAVPVEEVSDLVVEELDDMIEVERFDEAGDDQFEMILDENSVNSGDASTGHKDAHGDSGQGEESLEESTACIKKEPEEEDEAEKTKEDEPDPEVLSVLVTKVEEEEWIDEDEKSLWLRSERGEANDLDETPATDGTDESRDPIWFDEDERGAEQSEVELPKPKRRRKKPPPVSSKEKRAIKSVPNADGLFECKICGKTFSVQKTFLNHLRRHEHVQQGSFQCTKCDKVFGTRHRLSRHEPIHTRVLNCIECGKEFKNFHELRSHETVHLKGKQKCRRCDFVCFTRDEMKKHATTSECARSAPVKAQPKPPVLKDTKCPFEGCGYVAQTYGAMYVHKRTKHQAVHECDLCNKKFAFANQLKQHETVHTGEKPFKCDVCSKMFRRLFSFKEHMAIHDGEGRFECEHCGKVFARPRYLTAHMVTHTEDRPFSCTMCGSSYKTNGELTKHVRAKHESLEYGNGNDLIEEDYNYFEDEIHL